MATLNTLLTAARRCIGAVDARLLAQAVCGRTAAWLAANCDAPLAPAQEQRFNSWVMRREQGEPIAYLLGEREFYGRKYCVSPQVLIPRAETELLVDRALTLIHTISAPSILDLGAGSGCIAISLALEASHARVTAVDASHAALAVAQANAQRLNASVKFLHSDWYAALKGQRFDLIVANPPYLAAADSHLRHGDLRFEPPGALIGGETGLEALIQIIASAPAHLHPGGALLVEQGYDQAEAVACLFAAQGFKIIEQYRDLADIVRVTIGKFVYLR